MDLTDLRKLEAASKSKAHDPDIDVAWRPGIHEVAGAPVSSEALSLAGTTCLDGLSEAEVAELAKHEIASMFSAFVRFEGVLNQAISRMVRTADPLSPKTPYLLHIIEEEAKHSRMFARLVNEVGVGSYPPAGFFGTLERTLEPLIANSRLVFTYAMFAVEGITDTLIKEILRSGTKYPALRDVCRVHRIEEARHMKYAESAFADEYAKASRTRRFVLRCAAPWLAAAIYEACVPPAVYRRAGIADTLRGSLRLWMDSHRSPIRSRVRREAMLRVARVADDAGAISRVSRSVWRSLGAPVHVSQ